jgi:ABC-type antimicrobial peptide transport system permease subunit
MALGASTGRIRGLVVRQASCPVALGVVFGLAGAVGLGQAMSGLLFGLTAYDPATLALVVIALLTAAGAAIYLPVRRATAVDPATVLRAD